MNATNAIDGNSPLGRRMGWKRGRDEAYSLMVLLTLGMRVQPPTSTTRSISSLAKPAYGVDDAVCSCGRSPPDSPTNAGATFLSCIGFAFALATITVLRLHGRAG